MRVNLEHTVWPKSNLLSKCIHYMIDNSHQKKAKLKLTISKLARKHRKQTPLNFFHIVMYLSLRENPHVTHRTPCYRMLKVCEF